jgi:hypothetical protein
VKTALAVDIHGGSSTGRSGIVFAEISVGWEEICIFIEVADLLRELPKSRRVLVIIVVTMSV